MAHSSKRRRGKKRRQHVVVMMLKEGTSRQECPQCHTAIIDSPIPDRICWKCSPKQSMRQLKMLTKDKKEEEFEEPKGVTKYDKAQDSVESFLQKWHDENGMKVPECFSYWGIYFFSRGSMLREWGRCMNYWMKAEDMTPVTDMTPNKELERKIKERRESNGTTGPGFRTIEDKVANLRGDSRPVTTPSYQGYPSQIHTPGRGIQQVSHKAPSIARPEGNGGTEYVVI